MAGVPGRGCRACSFARLPAAGSALIRAPVSQVWEIVCTPESLLHADPQRVLCGGRVPGTPSGRPGDMRYYVHGQPAGDGRLTGSVYVLAAAEEQRSALAVQVSAPHFEVLHALAPDPGGTRLELTYRWPARTPERAGKR